MPQSVGPFPEAQDIQVGAVHRPALANRRAKGLSPDPISAESPHHALLPIVHVLARQAAKYTLARDRQPTPDQPSSEDEA